MAANVCCEVDRGSGGRVQRVSVAELQSEENEPVDGREDAALRKGRRVVVVPETVVVRAGWGMDGVVDSADEQEKVADTSRDLVEKNRLC